jgi:hypothetical protein
VSLTLGTIVHVAILVRVDAIVLKYYIATIAAEGLVRAPEYRQGSIDLS